MVKLCSEFIKEIHHLHLFPLNRMIHFCGSIFLWSFYKINLEWKRDFSNKCFLLSWIQPVCNIVLVNFHGMSFRDLINFSPTSEYPPLCLAIISWLMYITVAASFKFFQHSPFTCWKLWPLPKTLTSPVHYLLHLFRVRLESISTIIPSHSNEKNINKLLPWCNSWI